MSLVLQAMAVQSSLAFGKLEKSIQNVQTAAVQVQDKVWPDKPWV